MPSLSKKLFLATLLCSACHAAYAVTATEAVQNHPSSIFYNSGAEGWYWYQDPVPEPEVVLPEEVPVEPPKPEVKPEPEPVAQEAAKEGPAPFTLKWVQQMLPKYQEIAWDNPTPENVQAYFIVQRFAIDRANKFSDVAQQVVIGNVLLDETMNRPLSTFARPLVDRQTVQKSEELMHKIAQKAGIFFFFKSDCQYCEAQAPLVAQVAKEYDFDILPVSLDGGQLQTQQFENVRINSGQAEALGVQATPAMFLMNEEGKFTAIGQSLISYPELKRRIILVAHREGWITDEEFNETSASINPNTQHNLSTELPQLIKAANDDPMSLFSQPERSEMLTNLSTEEKSKLMDENNFISPAKLIALFGKSAQPSGQFNEDNQSENQYEN